MKYYKEKTLIFLLLIVITLVFIQSFVYIRISNSDSINETMEFELMDSGFWNLTGIPIFINDTDPSYNWSKTASAYDWCSGN